MNNGYNNSFNYNYDQDYNQNNGKNNNGGNGKIFLLLIIFLGIFVFLCFQLYKEYNGDNTNTNNDKGGNNPTIVKTKESLSCISKVYDEEEPFKSYYSEIIAEYDKKEDKINYIKAIMYFNFIQLSNQQKSEISSSNMCEFFVKDDSDMKNCTSYYDNVKNQLVITKIIIDDKVTSDEYSKFKSINEIKNHIESKDDIEFSCTIN